MSGVLLQILLLQVLSQSTDSGASPGPTGVQRVGPGVTPPRVLFKVNPAYTQEARDARIQGTVVFELVVNEQGRPTEISLLSPLGFGLDERGQEAIEKWRFEPGKKDGKPVKILATVEVNFLFEGVSFDSKTERHRTAYNIALKELRGQDPKRAEQGVETMKDLAVQKFPPAMFTLGTLYQTGDLVAQDPSQALALIGKAAEKKYGPAMYELGRMYWEGKMVPRDPERALHLMRDAAILGSRQAQQALGLLYEHGDGVEHDPDRARRYFRLCAASSTPECQLHLGRMLLELPDRRDRDYVQAIAWLLLASVTLPSARQTLDAELPKVTPVQYAAAQKLQAQLVHRQ